MKKKVIILVRNSNKHPSSTMVPFIKRTWVRNTKHKVFFVQSGAEENRIEGMDMFLTSPTGYMSMTEKMHDCLEYLNENNFEYDYVVMTTTGSYINFKEFDKFIEYLPSNNVYCGPLDFYPPVRPTEEEVIPFVSGRANIFSKDICDLIIANKDSIEQSLLVDDVAWGNFLIKENNIPPTRGYRQDFKNYPRLKDINFNNYHYGFRLDTWGIPRIFEIFSIYSIHKKMNYKYNQKESLAKSTLVKIFDFFFYNLFTVISFLNLKYRKSQIKDFLNSILHWLYRILKSNKILFKFFKKIKNKFNIRTHI
tara:strand:+ start:669 stop:1592 length:924 start_codon:yes stop_codon:yes gene_type:complete